MKKLTFLENLQNTKAKKNPKTKPKPHAKNLSPIDNQS